MSGLEGNEKWYQSRGIVGGVVGILVLAAGALGYAVSDEDRELIAVTIMGIGSGVGHLVGVYGRAKATKKIE